MSKRRAAGGDPPPWHSEQVPWKKQKWGGAPERGLEEQVSRWLCRVLRHDAAKLGLQMRRDGYVPLDSILALDFAASRGLDEAQVRQFVESNAKQRFGLAVPEGATGLHIRCHQGHTIRSIQDDELLAEVRDPKDLAVLCHGTFWDFWASIDKQGLKTMSRNHIHLVPLDLTVEKHMNATINGSKGSCDVVIFVDAKAAMAEGIQFFWSDNRVVLTRGVDGVLPRRFFSKVAFWNYDVEAWDKQLQAAA